MVAAPAAHDRAEVTADEAQDGGPNGPDSPERPSGLSGAYGLIAGVLVLLLVAAAAVGVWSYLRYDAAVSALDARADVVRAAERFTVQVNNYDVRSVEDYKTSVTGMLSTKFRTEFEQAMEDIVVQVQEAEMSSEGTVLASGVATISDDSARVLVVADALVSTVYDERQRHFRWEVSLVKVDGEWLIDDFAPVA